MKKVEVMRILREPSTRYDRHYYYYYYYYYYDRQETNYSVLINTRSQELALIRYAQGGLG